MTAYRIDNLADVHTYIYKLLFIPYSEIIDNLMEFFNVGILYKI